MRLKKIKYYLKKYKYNFTKIKINQDDEMNNSASLNDLPDEVIFIIFFFSKFLILNLFKISIKQGKDKSKKLFYCPYCKFTAKDKRGIKRHESYHHVKSRFQCPHCSFSVNLRSHVTRHINSNHKQLLQVLLFITLLFIIYLI